MNDCAPGGGDRRGRRPDGRDHVRLLFRAAARTLKHLVGHPVQVVDLAVQQAEHALEVVTAAGPHGDRLADYADRGHPATQFMGKHGQIGL